MKTNRITKPNKSLLKKIEAEGLKTNIPTFRIGDELKIYYKIVEGDKERVQPFEGTFISEKGSGLSHNITIRRISFGEGVERTFPLHSPRIDKIEVVRHGEVRRAKLYYLRDKVGKQAKIKERKASSEKTTSASEPVLAGAAKTEKESANKSA